MPEGQTAVISFGNWIIAFYLVYAVAAIAVVSALAVFASWAIKQARGSRLAGEARVTRPAADSHV